MFSLRSLQARCSLTTLSKRIIVPLTSQPYSILLNQHTHQTPQTSLSRPPFKSPSTSPHSLPQRYYSTKSSADALIEEIQDQYAVARDEFEISTEETEKKSVYAQADREAAREELDKLKEMYEVALKGKDGEEVKSRIGNRIRELDHAVQALEESALEH
ncbi:hypothetical protein IFR05_015134 [Cadophora sp. M221]|nr:hypothetical protein IFR05_015134 [Cadophora sp. M221]